tara:strand:+ start:1623 stop:2186 length:564 start_codon:yes stop_codon:yes gene_type:complete
MSTILYYSNYCDNCKTILQNVSSSKIKDDIHFVCIDSRVNKPNGATYIILSNGQEILLPPTIVKVPALLLLNKGHQVLFGSDINNYITPKQEVLQSNAVANNGEPLAFSLMGGDSGFGVTSDNYSFLDQDSNELSAKGNGGMRQQHHYASLDYNDNISTPPDTYAADTIGNVSLENLQQKRHSEVNM